MAEVTDSFMSNFAVTATVSPELPADGKAPSAHGRRAFQEHSDRQDTQTRPATHVSRCSRCRWQQPVPSGGSLCVLKSRGAAELPC